METAIFKRNLPIPNRVSPFSKDNGDRNKFLNLMRKLKPKHRLIGDLASRGWTAQMISKELRVHYKTVMEVLKRKEVVEYINISVTNLFLEADRLLLNIFVKSLRIIDQQLDSPDPEVKDRAVDKILKFLQPRGTGEKGKPLIGMFFSSTPEQEGEKRKTIDEVILEMRRKRGLPPHPTEDEL